ncbi:MAG: heparan-alpha-glucosaminide N-acetyltransferase domain-containing protein [Promethearchaeota archaeon]
MEKIEDNSLNPTEITPDKSYRIKSIDFVKGFAICLIILAHSAGVWKRPYLAPIYAIIYRYLDVFGPPLFIFLSGLSVAFTIKRKMGKIPERDIRNTIFMRGFSIIALGILYNLLSIGAIDVLIPEINVPFPLNLWGWNILLFIGFSQIITYYIMKLTRGIRALIGIVIILLTTPIYTIIDNPLYYWFNPIIWVIRFIVISPAAHNPILPYISICFFASIFGEILMEVEYLDSKEAKLDAFHIYMRNGMFFVLTGLILFVLDGTPFRPEPGFDLFFPVFVFRAEPSNMFYSIGVALIVIGGLYYFIDIKGVNNYITSVFIFYGKISLSLFIIHYIWLTLYVGILDLSNVWFIYGGYIAFLGFLMYIWNHQFDGKYSLEWMMGGFKTKSFKKNSN